MLAGKKALVTGSTSGIGLGTVRVLLRHGVTSVVLNGRRPPEDAAEIIEAIRTDFPSPELRIFYLSADVSLSDSCAGLLSKSIELMGGIDILVNNAGTIRIHPIETFLDEDFDLVMRTNLYGPFWLTKGAVKYWKEQQESLEESERVFGRVVNISSVYGLVGSAGRTAYVTSKHGLIGLTKVVALELAADTGITVNTVCPGYVNTPILQRLLSDTMKEHSCSADEARDFILSKKQPSKRFAESSDVGEYVAFLCSDAAHNITGSSCVIDGGWTAQ